MSGSSARCGRCGPSSQLLVFLTLLPCGTALFSIDDDSWGEGTETVKLKVLRNSVTGEYAEIAWNLGGRTEALVLTSPATGALRSVLWSSTHNASDAYANVGFKGDMLLPYANRIKNGTYSLPGSGTHYLARTEDRAAYGKNAIHGYLYDKVMAVASATSTSTAAVLALSYDFNGEDPGYPFPLSVTLTYTLDARGLTVRTDARNRGDSLALPFFNSWHAYFSVTDISRSAVQLDPCSRWNHVQVSNNSNIFGDMIPTGTSVPVEQLPNYTLDGSKPVGGTYSAPAYWDDEFKAVSSEQDCPTLRTTVTDLVTGEASVFWMDDSFRWLQVFTGAWVKFGVQGIAVEAMSSQCDAWNNLQGINLLQAGEEWSGEFGVYLATSEAHSRLHDGAAQAIIV